jgi:AraC-like DNA-binding protein
VVAALKVWETPPGTAKVSLNYWSNAVSEALFNIRIHTLDRDRFVARLEKRPFGVADMFRLSVSPQRIQRTTAAIAHDHCDDVVFNQVLRGEVKFSQFGREATVSAGDCFLTDTSSPYVNVCIQPLKVRGLRLPRQRLAHAFRDVEDIAARKIDGLAGWGAALGAFLSALDDDNLDLAGLTPSLILDQVINLLTLAFGSPPSAGTEALGTRQFSMLRRARLQLRERLDEEGLSPTIVAKAIGVSRSYLHELFGKAGTTFSTELEALKLDRACTLLAGVRPGRLSVSEVAARSGFSSAAHFSRKFRLAKGTSPSQFRTQVATLLPSL